jgi:WD40 repeat protein
LAGGQLLAETLETGTADEPEMGLLRSWVLPDGEPIVLGHVDWRKLGGHSGFFAPDGGSWLYYSDRELYSRPLPIGAARDRLLSRLRAKVVDFWTRSDSRRLVLADASGDTHEWTFVSDELPVERVIPKPEKASEGMGLDPSGHYLSGDPDAEQQVRLWDLEAWPEARPMVLRRSGSWYGSLAAFPPGGAWIAASTTNMTRLTFWPLGKTYPWVVDGYRKRARPVAFSPDGKYLATAWGERSVRLWPLPGSGAKEPRVLNLPDAARQLRVLAFDLKERFVFGAGDGGGAWVIPLDGSAPRGLPGFSRDSILIGAAVSPSGRFVAAAAHYGADEKTLRVWDLETGTMRRFDLPASAADAPGVRTGYERGITSLAFADESTLYTLGDGGLRRWSLDTGSQKLLAATASGYAMRGALMADRDLALTADFRLGQSDDCPQGLLHDLSSGTFQELTQFSDCSTWSIRGIAVDQSGTVAAVGSLDGTVQVQRISRGEPHLLVGHKGPVDYVAISPDLRWVATTGMDDSLRLWPMPDLSKPPLHTLLHDELLAKLHSLTNFRAVRDSSSPSGWKAEVGPFPGWKTVPTW